MNNTKVLALVTDAWGGHGGIAQYNRDLLSALGQTDSASIDVVVLGAELNGFELPDNVSQQSASGNKLKFMWLALISCIRRNPPSLLFCGHVNLAPVAGVLGKIFNVPFWLQVHGIDVWKRPSRIRSWGASKADLITAVSRFTRRKMLSWANISPERLKVLPNTVEQRFKPGPKSEALIDRYALRDKRVLLTISRLSSAERYKGHDQVLSSLPIILRDHPNTAYVIGGDGDDRKRLERIAKEEGVSDAVRFIGRVAESELVDTYRLADLFVMPSTGEGFGIVFLEAMACGVPVLGADADGSVDPLRDGLDGCLVIDEKLGPDELAGEILKCLITKKSGGRNRFGREYFARRVGNIYSYIKTKNAIV